MSYLEITGVALLIRCERTRSLPTFWSIWQCELMEPNAGFKFFFPLIEPDGGSNLAARCVFILCLQASVVTGNQRCSGLPPLGAVTHILFGESTLTSQILDWPQSWLGFFLKYNGKTRKNLFGQVHISRHLRTSELSDMQRLTYLSSAYQARVISVEC